MGRLAGEKKSLRTPRLDNGEGRLIDSNDDSKFGTVMIV